MRSFFGTWLGLAIATFAITISSAAEKSSAETPLFIELVSREGRPPSLLIFAGRRTEFVLTLTASAVIEPQLSTDLFAAAGQIAAPIATGLLPKVHRDGASKAGVQRFCFSLDLPALERRQKVILRTRVRTSDDGEWLPLPAVVTEVVPLTWRNTLRRFVEKTPSTRAADCKRLEVVFQRAGVNVPESSPAALANDPAARVWFADSEDDTCMPPTAPAVTWVVFKKSVGNDIEVTRAECGALVVAVDATVLANLDTDPAAQGLFERALATAEALARP
ncbi:MAG: hypothetical protein IPP19_01240 [Verrucomicrobia bacterium]|nr:hypothetical protein [Verrucomicrobiota bacterium]